MTKCCGGNLARQTSSERASSPPCPGQNKTWAAKGITALRVIQSPVVPDAVRTARDLACANCPYRYIVRGKNYCGCCNCPEWNFGSIGSDLGYKNTKAGWECPRLVPAFGPWRREPEDVLKITV